MSSLRLCTTFIALLSGVACLAQHMPVGCLSFEPALVDLHGTLIRKTFAGPPDYKDLRTGDQPETYWLLHLSAPVCVKGGDSDLNLTQKNIRAVQLVLDPAKYSESKARLGTKVIVSGTLTEAITGHHHTAVL